MESSDVPFNTGRLGSHGPDRLVHGLFPYGLELQHEPQDCSNDMEIDVVLARDPLTGGPIHETGGTHEEENLDDWVYMLTFVAI